LNKDAEEASSTSKKKEQLVQIFQENFFFSGNVKIFSQTTNIVLLSRRYCTVLPEIQEKDLISTNPSWATIEELVFAFKYDEAEEQFEQMRKDKLLDPSSYIWMLSAYVKARKVDKAFLLLEEIKTFSHTMNEAMFSHLLGTLLQYGGMEEKAAMFLQDMKRLGIIPTTKIIEKILTLISKIGTVEELLQWHNELRRLGQEMKMEQYFNIAKALHRRDPEMMTTFRSEMESRGVKVFDFIKTISSQGIPPKSSITSAMYRLYGEQATGIVEKLLEHYSTTLPQREIVRKGFQQIQFLKTLEKFHKPGAKITQRLSKKIQRKARKKITEEKAV